MIPKHKSSRPKAQYGGRPMIVELKSGEYVLITGKSWSVPLKSCFGKKKKVWRYEGALIAIDGIKLESYKDIGDILESDILRIAVC